MTVTRAGGQWDCLKATKLQLPMAKIHPLLKTNCVRVLKNRYNWEGGRED